MWFLDPKWLCGFLAWVGVLIALLWPTRGASARVRPLLITAAIAWVLLPIWATALLRFAFKLPVELWFLDPASLVAYLAWVGALIGLVWATLCAEARAVRSMLNTVAVAWVLVPIWATALLWWSLTNALRISPY